MASTKQIKQMQNSQDDIFDINDYGKVIASGVGREPDNTTIAMLLEKYDFDAKTLLNS